MIEEDRSAKLEGSVESSAIITGDSNTATISITNYYYREETKVIPVESIDAYENLSCPYRGLFHFGPDDAEYFFGREVFVEKLFAATQTRKFIPVLGASGSGKSSVVLAGLVPTLQQAGHWKFTHFRLGEGDDPFHALALALVPLFMPNLLGDDKLKETRKIAKSLHEKVYPLSYILTEIKHNYPQERVLLIADQFEELYTLCPDQKVRHSFLDTLLAYFQSSPDNTNVLVATMRADFLENALSYRPFADVLQNADVKLGPMNREELTEVIEKPAQKLNVTFEAGLVERILNDVEDQPGNLPLLEFALTALWNKRTGKQLTHKVYEEIGQVKGALARQADEKYGNLTDNEKEKVQRIFIQLVCPGEGVEDTRRIAMKAELGEQSWSLVKQLADARLVVTSRNATSQETVEVVHEALIRNWGELRKWMDANRVFRAWQERLRASKGQWEATKRDSGSLLRGAALAEAEEKLRERPEDLIDEQEFIEQSVTERDCLEKSEQHRLKLELEHIEKALKEANMKTRLAIITVGLTVVTLVAVSFSFWQQLKSQEIMEAVFLGTGTGTSGIFKTDDQELLSALPKLLIRADDFRNSVDKLPDKSDSQTAINYYQQHQKELNRLSAYYRKISATADELQIRIDQQLDSERKSAKDNKPNNLTQKLQEREKVKTISTKAKDSLDKIINKYHVPGLINALEILEKLKKVNINYSVDKYALLEWIGNSDRKYYNVAIECLNILQKQRLKNNAPYIDVIFYDYQLILGVEDLPEDPQINQENLKEAIRKAYNNRNGTDFKSFEAIVENAQLP